MSDDLPPPSPPDLPDPPKTSYQRPKPIEDPAERFLKSRGIGAEDAGKMGKAMGAGTALMGSLVGGVVLGVDCGPVPDPFGDSLGFDCWVCRGNDLGIHQLNPTLK